MEEIKKSMERIRESVGNMRQVAWNQKLENEYTKILLELKNSSNIK